MKYLLMIATVMLFTLFIVAAQDDRYSAAVKEQGYVLCNRKQPAAKPHSRSIQKHLPGFGLQQNNEMVYCKK